MPDFLSNHVEFAAFVWICAYLGSMAANVDAEDTRLLPHERHLRILEQARSRSRVEVALLADELEVTS